MQGIIHIFLLISSLLLLSTVRCDPNHHHDHNNNFPWRDLLSSLGITIENQTNNILLQGDANVGNKEHHTSEATLEEMISETTEEAATVQDGIRFRIKNSNSNGESAGLAIGYIIGIPIVGLICFICCCYYFCKCCCACCRDDSPNVVVMQQSPQQPAPAPQIILQQPIIHQQAPPVYDASQRWAQPPPHGPHQWNQPPQGPQFVPYSTGQQQHYSPNSGYDNPGFNPATAPPPYNTGKY